ALVGNEGRGDGRGKARIVAGGTGQVRACGAADPFDERVRTHGWAHASPTAFSGEGDGLQPASAVLSHSGRACPGRSVLRRLCMVANAPEVLRPSGGIASPSGGNARSACGGVRPGRGTFAARSCTPSASAAGCCGCAGARRRSGNPPDTAG